MFADTLGIVWIILAVVIHLTTRKETLTTTGVIAFWGCVIIGNIWFAA
jgi:hypothetical protein